MAHGESGLCDVTLAVPFVSRSRLAFICCQFGDGRQATDLKYMIQSFHKKSMHLGVFFKR